MRYKQQARGQSFQNGHRHTVGYDTKDATSTTGGPPAGS